MAKYAGILFHILQGTSLRVFSKIHIKRKSYNLLKAFYLFVLILGYLQERNALVHSVDSDIFYAMIHVPGCFQDFFIS